MGYDGECPARTAAAVLSDALGLDWSGQAGIDVDTNPPDPVLYLLRDDFMFDFLEEACDEWRLSRPAILRWARAWYLQRGVDEVPDAVAQLPVLQAW